MHLFLQCLAHDPRNIKYNSKSGFEANFKNINFKPGWGGKLDATFGVSIGRYSVSCMRGIDWKSSYISFSVSYTTKDKLWDFALGIYISMTHVLKLAIAATVVGVCVVLPALSPVFMSLVSALIGNPTALVGMCGIVLNGLSKVVA